MNYQDELNNINKKIAWDILDEPALKKLSKELGKIGQKLIYTGSFFAIKRTNYTSPDKRIKY